MGAKSVKRRVGYRREALHEDLARGGVPRGGSDPAFGVMFALLFAGLGAWLTASGRGAWPVAAFALAAALGLAAWLAPRRLAPLNRLWTRFGRLIHAVVSPVVLGLLFYGVITPTGLIMRALGKYSPRVWPQPWIGPRIGPHRGQPRGFLCRGGCEPGFSPSGRSL